MNPATADTAFERFRARGGALEVVSDRRELALSVGCYVKLVFGRGAEERERLWLEVSGIGPGRGYRAELRNVSLKFDCLDYGDLVEFLPEHVLEVQP